MLPYLITIGGFRLPTYGVLVAAAFLIALSLTGRLARRAGQNPDMILNLGIYCALSGILGAKLMMILVDLPEYLRDPGRLFSLSTLQAAGIFYGGFMLALATAYFYMRKQKLPLLATADLFAPGIALGHAIGRLGCFAAGCCYGDRCSLPWAVTFTRPEANELVGVPLNTPLHPTQLYEAAAEVLICLFLLRMIKRPHQAGAVIGWYVVLYSGVRFAVDFLRHQDQGNVLGGPFTTAQTISLGLIALVAIIRFRIRKNISTQHSPETA